MKNRILSLIFGMFVLLVLAGCGGGGNNQPPANNTNTDWDQMVWDQDEWS